MSVFARFLAGFMLALVLTAQIAGLSVHADEPASGFAQQETVYLPWMGSRTCDRRVRPTMFGVQMYGRTDSADKYFESLQYSGATWVRVPVSWASVEPKNTDTDGYDWQAVDLALAAAQDGCLNIIATHRGNPAWAATSRDGPIFWGSMDDIAEYMAALVERYDGDGYQDAPGSPIVRYWEMYNEPDIVSSATGWGQYPDRYAAMLKHVYPAMKAAHPATQVLLGGLAYERLDEVNGPFSPTFLADVVDAGGGDYFDIGNFHYFPIYFGNWTKSGPGLSEKTQAFRQEMHDLGIDKPIVITEAGHFVNSDGSVLGSPELQLRFLVEMYAQAKASDVKILIWFSLYDLEDYPERMGLVTRADPPYERSSYAAFQFAAKQLRDVLYEVRLSSSETGAVNMEVHKLHEYKRKVDIYVAWLNPVTTGLSKPLTLKASKVTVRDAFGVESVVRDKDDGKIDGRVTVDVGGRPIYIEVKL